MILNEAGMWTLSEKRNDLPGMFPNKYHLPQRQPAYHSILHGFTYVVLGFEVCRNI